ncbi:MAG: dienelactone hydrolase family protein [Planctomycetales bacterium]
MSRLRIFTFIFLGTCAASPLVGENDALPPLSGGKVPQTVEEIWGDYDPQREPVEAEVLKEWEEGEVVCRIVRFRIGIFKGVKSVMGGLYAFPRSGTRLPGLVQVHGGGQSANLNAATTNARRGYACLSLNWGGNPLNDGNYQKLWPTPGTDWGAMDGTHPPQRDPVNHFHICSPNEWTIDSVESPRNSAWLLVAIGVRRALTFLEQQPEVDGKRLGIYGHSMGAKLTVMVAALDQRVRAAVPSCGGITDFPSEPHWENSHFCRRLSCPVMFLNPVNDFYGKVDDLNQAVESLAAGKYRFACAPNLDHRDLPEHFVCGPLWFDQHLQGAEPLPQTPECELTLKSPEGVPVARVLPDISRPVQGVDVYYTQQVRDAECPNPCWRHVAAKGGKSGWTAPLPLFSVERPLRVYANVRYGLETPIAGAGYYYSLYSAREFVLSSRLLTASVERLREAKLEPTDQPSLLIEAFDPGWERGWYVYNENGTWPFRTNKLQDPKWKAPAKARLVLEVQSLQPGELVLEIDQHAAVCRLNGGEDWQSFSLSPGDFLTLDDDALADWSMAKELVIADRIVQRIDGRQKSLGGAWQGELPRFRRLRWEPDSR